MQHDHSGHDHDPGDRQRAHKDAVLRVQALESLLVEKGMVDPAALDAIAERYAEPVGPKNGARVVARKVWEADADIKSSIRIDFWGSGLEPA